MVLPELLCEEFAITDWIAVVGLGDRFQIWARDAFHSHRTAQRRAAREGLAALRNQQRLVRPGSVA